MAKTEIICPNGRYADIEKHERKMKTLGSQQFEHGVDYITLYDKCGDMLEQKYCISYENGMSDEEVIFKMTGLIDYLMKVITNPGFATEFKKRLKDDKWGTHYNVYFNGDYNVSDLDFKGNDISRFHFHLTKPSLTLNYDTTKGDL